MIFGTGIDIIEIERIQKAIENTNFTKRFFSEKEQEYFLKKNMRPETVAGNFAAKEAFSKALGTGFSGFELKDVEILRDGLGKPYIEVGESLTEKLDGKRIFVSISHSEKYAVANVIIEE